MLACERLRHLPLATCHLPPPAANGFSFGWLAGRKLEVKARARQQCGRLVDSNEFQQVALSLARQQTGKLARSRGGTSVSFDPDTNLLVYFYFEFSPHGRLVFVLMFVFVFILVFCSLFPVATLIELELESRALPHSSNESKSIPMSPSSRAISLAHAQDK